MPIRQYAAESGSWVPFDGGTATESTSVWPDASNTGVPHGTALKVVGIDVTSGTGWHARDIGSGSQSVSIDAANVTLDGLDIPGGVYNNSGFGGLTIKNCRIRLIGWTDGSQGAYLGPGSVMMDCEMGGGADGNTRYRSTGITSVGTAAAPNVIRRVEVRKITHCIHTGSYTSVYDSWLHDCTMGDTDLPNMAGDHTEAVFVTNGQQMLFQHNRMDSGNTSVFFGQNFQHTADGTGNVTITGNKFEAIPPRNAEWSNAAIRFENKMINGPITITDNVFDGPAPAGSYPQDIWALGYVIECPATFSTVSGNTYVDGSSADGDSVFDSVVY